MTDRPPSADSWEELSERQRQMIRARLERVAAEPAGKGRDRIPRRPADEPPVLSMQQEGFWFDEQVEPGHPALNRPLALRLRGPLEPSLLEAGLERLVERHRVLSSTIASVDGAPRLSFDSPTGVSIPLRDLSDRGLDATSGAIAELLAHESRRPFDLERGPLWRAALFRLGAEEHVLLVVFHHIVFDGWSSSVFQAELEELYRAERSGEKPDLAPLELQYDDYAHWQRRHDADIERGVAYWRERVSPDPARLALPDFRPPPATPGVRAATARAELPSELLARLRRLGESERATLFTTLLAATYALLFRYTGVGDLQLAALMANRTRPELEPLIGLFVNQVVLRGEVDRHVSFRDLLRQTRRQVLEAVAHQDTPLPRVVEAVRPSRSLAAEPLYDVTIQLRNFPRARSREGPLRMEPLALDWGAAAADLAFVFEETDSGELVMRLEHRLDLVTPQTADRALSHLANLLAGIAERPDARLADLPLLDEAERRTLLFDWNATETPLPEDPSIASLFAERVRTAPRQTALRTGGNAMSYADLAARAHRIARRLRDDGIDAGDFVAICLPRSADAIAAMLAVLELGAAYLPLDPGYPPERLRYMLEDSGAKGLVTGGLVTDAASPLATDAGPTPAVTLVLDRERATLEALDPGPLEPARPGDDIAYVVYTSGSTGEPRGVLGTHRGAINRLRWMWREFPFDDAEVCCQTTALSFVDSVTETFGPLLAGVPLVIADEEQGRDVHRLLELLSRERVTRLLVVPSLLARILDAVSADGLEALQLWVTSGELLSDELRRRFHETLPGRRLLNLYGSSEISGDVSFHETGAGADETEHVPIGRPIDNTRLYVLDADRNPVPVGVRGEIWAGGAGVARGYLGRRRETAERFLEDPFLGHPERVFRTGDLGRFRPDGNLEYLGRVDRQVKIRGFRVAPQEIEAALEKHPGVARAVVIGQRRSGGDTARVDRLLAAIVAPHDVEPPADGDLRSFLLPRLPDYMIPNRFVVLDELPMTANGKVDLEALKALEVTKTDAADDKRPVTPLQEQLVEIWEKVLDRRPIGVAEDFFELGGHSLLAVEMLFAVEAATGRRLPVRVLFSAPTIESLAALLTGAPLSGGTRPLAAIRTEGEQAPFFMVHAAGGLALSYRNLADRLAATRPFYAFERPANRAELAVSDMAEMYLAEMRRVQPSGPYFLGGVSFGGFVAWEIARRLEQRGQPIALLALIDTRGPGLPFIGRRRSRLYQLRRSIEFQAGRLRMGSLRDRLSAATEILAKAGARLREALRRRARARKAGEALAAVDQQYRHDLRALRRYVPPPLDCPVTLFRGTSQPPGITDRQLGWDGVARNLTVVDVPGAHQSILTGWRLEVLAGELQKALDQSEAGP